MPRSSLSKAIVNGWAAGAARQSLSYLLSLAVIDSAVPFGEHVPGFGLVSAKDRPPATSQDIAATAGRNAAMTVKRALMRPPPPRLTPILLSVPTAREDGLRLRH